jgi:hypothetical protein
VVGWEVPCDSTKYVLLAWSAASDPSGVSQYQVAVQAYTGSTWASYDQFTTKGTDLKMYPTPKGTNFCVHSVSQRFRVRVRARDGAGNWGDWSGWREWMMVVIVY